ncbi:uncharacterized protein LOC142181865 [Nicotiana tabacum]|uniref:Uncharacterized protein LOC142181865 n=1 Tax=Nicotiana tabacum TaxID=4097 RepID=A0AC58UQ18_TOBAC
MVQVQILMVTTQMIHCQVKERGSQFSCYITFVNGKNKVHERRELWDQLRQIHSIMQEAWLVIGDFNSVLSGNDRINGQPIHQAELVDFQDCIRDIGVGKLNRKGCQWSWCNKRDAGDRIYSNIDWAGKEQNCIYLYEQGKRVLEPKQIEQEFKGFFQSLLGTSASEIPCINIAIARDGHCLTKEQQQLLSAPVTMADIDMAVKELPNEKAPGMDGFPADIQDHIQDPHNKIEAGSGLNCGTLSGKKGLRQGDPMSPYLFVLVMEYLNRVLKKLKDNPDFNYHLKCSRNNITHKCFADDLIMCCRADRVSIRLAMDRFNHFSEVSSLKANMEKSVLYIAGVRKEFKEMILEEMQFTLGELPFKYLGVPLSSKKLTVQQCMPLIEKITARINCWTAKLLSYSGRLQLLKSVIFEMQTYWAQVFLLPKKILKLIISACRTFLWTGRVEPSRRALIT